MDGYVVAPAPVRLWKWWKAEISSIFPQADMRRPVSRKARHEIHVTEGAVQFFHGQSLLEPLDTSKQGVQIGELGLTLVGMTDLKRVLVSFGPGSVFARRARLPLAALDRAEQILDLELKRLLPVPGAELVTAIRQSGPVHDQQVEFDQVALRRSQLQAILKPCLDRRIDVAAVAFRPDSGPALPIILDSDGSTYGTRSKMFWKRLAGLLAGLFAFATLGAGWLVMQRQNQDLQTVQDASEGLRAPAAEVRKVIESFRSQSDVAANIVAIRKTTPRLLPIWEELSKILPDQAWFTTFSMKDDSVTVDGEAQDAESLVQAIEASALFKNSRFVSPVVKNPGEVKARFSMAFELESLVK
jgi:Tfp pilus assembly protein PilN